MIIDAHLHCTGRETTDDVLRTLPNTVLTPHLGYVTHEEYETQFSDIFDQILAYAAGAPINVVNPAVLAGPTRPHPQAS